MYHIHMYAFIFSIFLTETYWNKKNRSANSRVQFREESWVTPMANHTTRHMPIPTNTHTTYTYTCIHAHTHTYNIEYKLLVHIAVRRRRASRPSHAAYRMLVTIFLGEIIAQQPPHSHTHHRLVAAAATIWYYYINNLSPWYTDTHTRLQAHAAYTHSMSWGICENCNKRVLGVDNTHTRYQRTDISCSQ